MPIANRNKKETKFSHISNVLNNLSIFNKKNKLKTEIIQISKVWSSCIESPISENSCPHFFKKGTLTIKVTDSNWMNSLQYLKTEMIEKINTYLGKDLINNIKFII